MSQYPEIVDLTHWLDKDMSVYPGDPVPEIEQLNTMAADGFRMTHLDIHSHLGTHIDAPSHIVSGGKALEEFPLSKFRGTGICIDCRQKRLIEPADLKLSRDTTPDFILLYTGKAKHWNTEDYFSNFPRLSGDACILLAEIKPKGIGIDCASFDSMEGPLDNHRKLLNVNILLIENLCNLENLLDKRFTFYCLPLKYRKADGSPIRAFAEIQS